MTDCPNADCKQDLAEVRDIVFKDAPGGCRFDINRLVSKKLFWLLFVVIGIPAYYAGVNVWAEDKTKEVKIGYLQKDIQEIKGILMRAGAQDERHEGQIRQLEGDSRHNRELLNELKTQQKADVDRIINAIEKKR